MHLPIVCWLAAACHRDSARQLTSLWSLHRRLCPSPRSRSSWATGRPLCCGLALERSSAPPRTALPTSTPSSTPISLTVVSPPRCACRLGLCLPQHPAALADMPAAPLRCCYFRVPLASPRSRIPQAFLPLRAYNALAPPRQRRASRRCAASWMGRRTTLLRARFAEHKTLSTWTCPRQRRASQIRSSAGY